jgi:hypothetical protein
MTEKRTLAGLLCSKQHSCDWRAATAADFNEPGA